MAKERRNQIPDGEPIMINGQLYVPVERFERPTNLPARRTTSEVSVREALPAPVEESKKETLKKLGNVAWLALKWSPPGLLAQVDVAYAKYIGRHPRSKIAWAGAVPLVAAQAWLGINTEPVAIEEVNCSDIHRKTVEVGADDVLFGEKGEAVKNGFRSTIASMTLHHVFADNRNWDDLATALTDYRHYDISAARLKEANKSAPFARKDGDGNVEDSLDISRFKGTSVRITIPGPINGGQLEVKGGETLEDIAKETKITDADKYASTDDETKKKIDLLRQRNPNLAKIGEDEDLPEGLIVQVEDKVDTRLVYRSLTRDEGTMREATAKDPTLNIEDANAWLRASGHAPDGPGDMAYLKILGRENKDDKVCYSAEQLRAAYDTKSPKTDQKQKPVTPKIPPPVKPKTPKPEQKPPANKGNEELVNTGDIPADMLAAMKRQYAKSRYYSMPVLAGQSRTESDHRKNLVSRVGAKGPAQFMPGTWKTWGRDGNGDGRKDVTNPDDAYAAQVAFMDKLYEEMAAGVRNGSMKGDPEALALQAYNWGPGFVKIVGRVATKSDVGKVFRRGGKATKPVPTEAVNYPVKVLKFARGYGYKG